MKRPLQKHVVEPGARLHKRGPANEKVPIARLSLGVCATLVQADYLDVLAFKLKPACTLKDFITLNQQMNAWGKPYNMTSEVVVPVFSDMPDGYAWVGRTPNAAAFGKAWDAWRTAVVKDEEPVSKLNARWAECTQTVYRRSFDSY